MAFISRRNINVNNQIDFIVVFLLFYISINANWSIFGRAEYIFTKVGLIRPDEMPGINRSYGSGQGRDMFYSRK